MNIKQNKGIGLSDGIIAVAILVIFTGVVVSISYNIYLQSNYIKRNEQATNYIVETFEYAKGLLFDEVTQEKIVSYINSKYSNTKAIGGKYTEDAQRQASYTIFVNIIDKYPNYIKQLEISVMYKLGNKNRVVNMQTLINK